VRLSTGSTSSVTAADAEGNSVAPLIVLDRIEAFLDEHGLGSGPLRVSRIGVPGGSNFSFLLERDEGRYVLRRPPRPPLPPSAHDMVREARLQLALAKQGIKVPPIVAVGENEDILGIPFYVMDFVEGFVIADSLPPELEHDEEGRHRLGLDLVDTLAQIHGVDVHEPDLATFIRSGSYSERQVRRWTQLWEINQTRELPVPEIARRMALAIPEGLPLALVPRRLPHRQRDGRRRPGRDRRRARLGDGRDRRPARRRRLSARDLHRAERPGQCAWLVARHGRARLSDARAARQALYREQRARRAAARVVRGARRCGKLRGSAKRSTAGTCAANSAPRTRARRSFEVAVPLLAETALETVS